MRTRTVISLAAGIAAALALPAVAGANVYCVDLSGGDCTHLEPNGAFQQALNDAANNPGPDTVRLGPVTYTGAAASTGFNYLPGDGAALSIIGSGAMQTTVTKPAVAAVQNTVLNFNPGSAGSVISDLRVEIPTPVASEQYRGIQVAGGGTAIERVTVNAAAAFNGFGVILPSGSVSDSTISLVRNGAETATALELSTNTPDDILVERSSLTATSPLVYQNDNTGVLSLRRSTLRGDANGLAGLDVRGGTAVVESTVIDMNDFGGHGVSVGNPNNFAADTADLTLDGVTASGTGAGARGLDVFATDPLGGVDDTVSVTVRNTILDQFDTAIWRRADEGDTANVSVDYSNYDFGMLESDNNPNGMGGTGSGAISEGANRTNFDPMFLDAASGDFHLLASSPLLDLGDPAAPPVGATDLDGDSRALDTTFDCSFVQRRDVGADELAGVTQGTPASCIPPQGGGSVTPTITPTPTPAPAPRCKKVKAKKKKKKRKKCRR